MAFHNVRLPVDVERGAEGGPEFKTLVTELASGREKRNIEWERVRGQWELAYGYDSKANHEAVLSFFYARQGKAHGFRFKDWTDFQIGTSSTDTPQEIATADGSTRSFQIVRRYTDGTYTFDRKVTRPVAGTVRVFLDGVEQLSGWSVDNNTGIVTFSVAPTASPDQSIGVICEFDTPVRFDIDFLRITAERDDVFQFASVPIKELRE